MLTINSKHHLIFLIGSFTLLNLFPHQSWAQGFGAILPPSLFGPPVTSPVRLNSTHTFDTSRTDTPSYKNNQWNLLYSPQPTGFLATGSYNETELGDQNILLEDGTEVGRITKALQVNLGYSYVAKDKSLWSFLSGFGSASDQLFARGRDNTIVASVVNVRPGQTSRWIFGAFFNNNLNIGTFPLPIIAYMYRPSKTFNLVTGLPFVSLRWGSFTGSSLFALATPGNARFVLSQGIWGPIAVNASWQWRTENYQHAQRQNEDSQFFIERQLLQVGLRAPVAPGVLLNLSYGQRTESRFFQAEGIFDQTDAKFDLQDAQFFNLSINARF